MLFNSEAEVEAYYRGREEEADRWGWWKDGVKWCGLLGSAGVTSLQDIRADLRRQQERALEWVREEKERAATSRPKRNDLLAEEREVRRVLPVREEAAGALPIWLR